MSKFATIEERVNGTKPDLTMLSLSSPTYDTEYSQAINWANNEFDDKQLKAFALQYFEEINLAWEEVKILPDWRFNTLGKIGWVYVNGGELSNRTIEWVSGAYSKLLEMVQVDVVQTSGYTDEDGEYVEGENIYDIPSDDDDQKLSAKEREKIHYINTYSQIDNLLMQKSVTFEALREILNGNDDIKTWTLKTIGKEYKELYGSVKKFGPEDWEKPLKLIVSELENRVSNGLLGKKANNISNRTQKMIQNVKVQNQNDEYNITSVDPALVVKSRSAIIFNSKTRKASYYVSKGDEGLGIKGTTIQNYDEEKSICRTVRKPEQFINDVRRAEGSARIEQLYETRLKGKSFPLTGRLTSETLILKVFHE